MGVISSLWGSGKAVHHYGNSHVLAVALGRGVVGLYQIIGALVDNAGAKGVVDSSFFTVNPATCVGISSRGAGQLDSTAAANRAVAANGRCSGYWVDGYGNLLSAAAFATGFAVV